MKSLIAFLVLFMLAIAGCRGPKDTGVFLETDDTVFITDNGGGTLGLFEMRRAKLKASGKRVVISGYCASGCTIFYSLPNACMAKGSSLHFHGAAGLPIAEDIANIKLARYYRAGIKKGFESEWYKYSKPMYKLTREQAKALDPDIKFCEAT